ncbi:MAG: TolC family protein [Saprospiraceae bacterium]|nr:TolC family protein [Saprospiraceae bacterium]
MGHIKNNFILSAFILFVHMLGAQEVLSLKDAIRIAVEHNYDVRIARNETEIDKTNNTLGNAGILPRLDFIFGQNYNINNTSQEFFSGETRTGSNVNTSNLNANLQLAWTLFDGMNMFVNKERLSEIVQLGQLNVQFQMENTISQVMSLYYNIVQHQHRIETIQKAIEISQERLTLARLKKDIGTGSGIPVLQAEVDINSDSSALIMQHLIFQNTKIQLNEILGRSPETEFDIIPMNESQENIDYQGLVEKATQRNLLLQMADKSIRLSELNLKQWQSNKYPTVDLNLGYNFTRFQAEIGILKFNQNNGWSFGLTGRWNIFDGSNNNREIQVAKLGIETIKLTKEQTALSLKSNLFTIYNNYRTAQDIKKLEEHNIRVAQQNLDITTEKMRIGTIDALELRQAQLNLVDAEFRKITADFESRMSYLELMKLSGQLMN